MAKFKPGESGNPKGRPKGTGESAKLRRAIAADVPEIIAAEAARRADIDGVIYTAAEVEVLAQFDAQGIRDLTRMKAALGGTLGQDMASPANRACDDE